MMNSPYLIEWFLVPLGMYLLSFWLRDNANILHMPLADLVALLVIADVTMAFHSDMIDAVLSGIKPDLHAPKASVTWWVLAALGTAICVLLVYGIEKRILRVAIHHVSVGLWHRPSASYVGPLVAFRDRQWRRFLFRWR